MDAIRAEQDNLVQALRYGAGPGGRRAPSRRRRRVLGGLWFTESNFTRLAALAADTARVLSHFRPEPDLVEVDPDGRGAVRR